MSRFFAVLMGSAFLVVAGIADAASRDDCHLTLKTTLRATITKYRILVEVHVNGTPVNFVLDTGATHTSMSVALATRLGLTIRTTNTSSNISVGGEQEDRAVGVDEFMLGDHLRAATVIMPAIGAMGDGAHGEEAGLLGFDFLGGYDIEIDPANQKINLYTQDHCKGRVVYWNSAYFQMPFDLVPITRAIKIPVEIDGHPLTAVLDTGVSKIVLGEDIARNQFDLTTSDGRARKGMDAQGNILKESINRFKRLDFGPIALKNPEVDIVKFGRGEVRLGSRFGEVQDNQLLVGMEVLSKLHSFISYGEEVLYFTLAAEHDLINDKALDKSNSDMVAPAGSPAPP